MNTDKHIFIFDRHDSLQRPGGDTVQILAIQEFLEANGYRVTRSRDLLEDLSPYDMIFIFNLTLPFAAYLQAKAAQKANKPYLVFPVFWDLDSLDMGDVMKKKEWLKRKLPSFLKSWVRAFVFWRANKTLLNQFDIRGLEIRNVRRLIQFVLKEATAICPNSFAEQDHLVQSFGHQVLQTDIQVVYNGVLIDTSMRSIGDQLEQRLPKDYICCAGGIGPRKNQLQLVKAANLVKVPLVIVGQAARGCDSYAEHIRSIAGDQIVFLDHLSREEVQYVMSRSRGHIQPSYIETPGLASLEAAVIGCPIGVSDVAPVREYFQDYAEYCNPHDVESIGHCLLQIWQMEKRSHELRDYISSRFNWTQVLQPLLDLLAAHTNNTKG